MFPKPNNNQCLKYNGTVPRNMHQRNKLKE